MASAERTTRTVEQPVTVLTLTLDEAQALQNAIGEARTRPELLSILEALEMPHTPAPVTPAEDPGETIDGITYKPGVRYRDEDGDLWIFKRGRYGYLVATSSSWSAGMTLQEVLSLAGSTLREDQ
ncbi:hypothetical protein [Streptomyces sp. CAU 1734]|uniref:hypothetical protein n=1 Tax=Streptomyces sp. CAU 1734 TaxID=3140360 RepID=UPI0032607BDF